MRPILLLSLLFLSLPARANLVERVPAWLLELPDSVDEVLIADAGTATLHRFENNGHGIQPADRRYMSIGRNGVGKQRAWDRKTPLGIYFITEELDTSRLHDKYGDAAFVLDYPNAWDRHRQRTGDGIWLHGVDRNAPDRPPLDTDGCLALPNEEITRLAGDLDPLVTPVIVAREMQWASPLDVARQRAEFRAMLDRWRQAVASADLPAYLALYAPDFRQRGMSRDEWSAWRRGVFAKRGAADLRLEDVTLMADPEEDGLYMSRFRQVLEQDAGRVVIQKRLYWRRDGSSQWRIVAEDNG